MKTIRIVLAFSILLIAACNSEEIPLNRDYIYDNGWAIVGNYNYLWKVPIDAPSGYTAVVLNNFFQFEDKVIVTTFKKGVGGIRCMEIESGKVLWEQFFGAVPDVLGEMITFLYIANFNNNDYIIVSEGTVNLSEVKHHRINLKTGEKEWTLRINSFPNILSSDGEYYYCTVCESNNLYMPIYRINTKTGIAEHFFQTDILPTDAGVASFAGLPFVYNGKEYMIVEYGRWMKGVDGFVREAFSALLDMDTHELISDFIPVKAEGSNLEFYNGKFYILTDTGYRIFDVESRTYTDELNIFTKGTYLAHYFHNDKLVLCLTPLSQPNGCFDVNVIDPINHKLLYSIIGSCSNKTSSLNGILYLARPEGVFAYNIETGKKMLSIKLPQGRNMASTYLNAQGQGFVVVEDIYNTYCYPTLQ